MDSVSELVAESVPEGVGVGGGVTVSVVVRVLEGADCDRLPDVVADRLALIERVDVADWKERETE